MNEDFWARKIKAFLHDPPDKALKISGHRGRRDKILTVIDLVYDESLNTADWISSAMQRLNIPSECDIRIDFEKPDKPLFKHTLSATEKRLQKVEDLIAEKGFDECFKIYSFDPDVLKPFIDKSNWKKTYFSIWRIIPEKYPLGKFIPADTRIPDHSIWDHLDITSAIVGVLDDFGLFAVKILSVKEFIYNARKLSDLWAGSHLLSYLIFNGIISVVDELGPDVVIFPYLRGQPLLDNWINENFSIELQYEQGLKIANLPNTFLCVIPHSRGKEFGIKVKEKILNTLKEISNYTKKKLKTRGAILNDDLWDKQINNAIFVCTTYLKIPNVDKYKKIRNYLPNDLVDKQDRWLRIIEGGKEVENFGHFYAISFEILQAIITQKSRLFNQYEEMGGEKCSMCGTRNSVVKRGVLFEKFGGKMFKENESLCAVCLIKRFYREVISKSIGTELGEKFESVVEISARDFIDSTRFNEDIKKVMDVDVELVYQDQWELEEKKEAIKKIENASEKFETLKKLSNEYGEPNKYYAILMMDGDNIGKILSGEKLTFFGEFLHPLFEKCIRKNDIREVLDMRRVLSPSVHIAISRALKYFSVNKLSEVIEKYKGFLVYSGGDDVLALFPVNRVLKAASEIEEIFSSDFYEINGEEVLGLGKNASMSAGIAFAHYKYPLYDALRLAKEAEREAKNKYGRKAFSTIFIKRSGELVTSGGKWDFVEDILEITRAIVDGKISHRFIYDFIDVAQILSGDTLNAEVKRLLNRRKAENVSEKEINEIYGRFSCLIGKYRANNFEVNELANVVKILYDAMRGEEG